MNYEDLLNEMGYGKDNMFIHGGAGSGKSTLIKDMQNQITDGVIYAGPTGQSALNIHGQTIHSLFNLKPSLQLIDDNIFLNNSQKLIFQKAYTLLIDEISMVRCDVLDKIDRILRTIRQADIAFGGMRVIFVGDLFQIGAITLDSDKNYLRKMYPSAKNDFSFYNAHVFQKEILQSLHIYELSHNFRQSDDPFFFQLLNIIRFGNFENEMLKILNCRHYAIPDSQCPFLTIKNDTARIINNMKLVALNDTAASSIPEISPFGRINDELVKACPMSNILCVKKGMQILFVMNDSKKNGNRWVNGTIGEVIDKSVDSNGLLKSVIVKCGTKQYEVFRQSYDLFQPYYNSKNDKIEITKSATVNNFPFIAAWATTICRSQGLTLDKVNINFEYGAYPGQAYVALSRVRKLENIFLTRPITQRDISVSRNTQKFYNTILSMIKYVG